MTSAAPPRAAGVKDAVEVARAHADEVDAQASFPAAAFDALREHRLVGAVAPESLGGAGLSVTEAVEVARSLGSACGATALVWTMHQGQIVSVLAGQPAEPARALLDAVLSDQGLIASVTSEVGRGGDLRNSTAALVEDGPGRWRLEKQAPTISYAEHASAYLVTCRRHPDAEAGDQVAVFAAAGDVSLEPKGPWDPLGMRGTQSPPFLLNARVADGQVLETPFGDIAGSAMVPWSHVLWSAAWLGIAQEALARARRIVRGRKATASPPIAEALRELTILRALIEEGARRCPPIGGEAAPADVAWFNDLKISASEMALGVALRCLNAGGMVAFQERSELSLARPLRDLLSASLMVGNDRLRATNAAYALVRGA